jgi:sulfite reductase (NADPH) hemoprotein beta-component
MTKTTNQQPEPAVNEYIKASSNYLRGTIIEGLQDYVTGSISAKDQQLLKFHGIYQQDDRDVRMERKKQKLEPAYGFMIRVRVPGGIFSPECWQLMDELASQYGHDNFRLTTRQAFQLHGVLKKDLKPTIQNINQKLMDTIAACGDVNRNVMCSVAPQFGPVYDQVYDYSCQVSAHLTPRSNAYHEIWLGGEKITAENDPNQEVEPIYGKTYLPRKFKIGFVIPPMNDIDVFSQDIGFVAVTENDQLTAFNVVVGGGMGNTHGDTTTYPCVGVTIGACKPDEVVEVAEKIVTIQRDYGNRSNRKRARLKYTIEECGLDWFKQELENRSGISLAAAHTVSFQTSGDDYGWHYHQDGTAHLTLFVPQGRVIDYDKLKLRTGLRALADKHQGKMILTPNQNVTLAHIKPEEQARIQAIVDQYDLINQHGKLSATGFC